MATNFNTNPFGIYAHPFSGSAKTGSTVDVINFVNASPFFTSSKQADVGSIGINYTQISISGSDAGAAADIVFKVSGKEAANKDAAEVFRISATGSSNEARIGIGMGKSDTIDSILHVKGETLIDGDFKIKSGSETISLTKDDLKDLVQGKAISDSSGAKNAARGGLTQTFAANALVNLADTSTLVKANEVGKLELKANNDTLIELDNSVKPKLFLGGAPTGTDIQITGLTTMSGSLNVTGSNVTFDVEDLLTLLGNFGQTGSFAVSGSSDFTGDVNMDGAVTVADLLTVVAGFGATGSNSISGSLVINDNHSGTALSITGSTNVSGSSVFTGSFTASGSVFLDGATTVTDILNAIAGFEVSGSSTLSGSVVLTGSFNSDGDVIVGGDVTASRFIATSVGGASSPNYTFNTDPDSGMFMPAPNNLHIQVGGGNAEVRLNTTNTKLYNDTRVTAEAPTIQLSGSNKVQVTGSFFANDIYSNNITAVGGTDLNISQTSGLIQITGSNVTIDTATGGNVRVTGSFSVGGGTIDLDGLPTSDPGVAGQLYTTGSAFFGGAAGLKVLMVS